MISSILTSPTIYNLAQNTATQVGIETSLKAVGRPGFILIDKDIDSNTKKYSATKEFLYQLTCLAVSLGAVVPIFKKGSFGIARKLFKDEAVFKAFKKSDDFNKFRKLSQDDKIKKLNEINQASGTNYELKDINEDMARGMIEVTSIAGSIMGLSILSPLISRPFIRPVLKKLGISGSRDEPQKAAPQPAKQSAQPQKADTKLDVKA